jgi:hypothetical protein
MNPATGSAPATLTATTDVFAIGCPAEGLEQTSVSALRQYLTERAMRLDILLSPNASAAPQGR